MLPGGQEPTKRRVRHRLDLLAQRRKRATAQATQHIHRTPLGAARAGTELTIDDPTIGREATQGVVHDGCSETEAGCGIRQCEGSVGAGVATHEVADRIVDGFDERGGHPNRQRNAERITQSRGIFDAGPAAFARDGHFEHAVRFREPRQVGREGFAGHERARLDLGDGLRAKHAQQVDEPLGIPSMTLGRQPL